MCKTSIRLIHNKVSNHFHSECVVTVCYRLVCVDFLEVLILKLVLAAMTT